MKSNKGNGELFNFDEKQREKCKFLIGVDEAGRGPAAGPVYAAAACFKVMTSEIQAELCKLNDSKKMSEKSRFEIFPLIEKACVYSVCCVDEKEIDKINILNATFKAMKFAVEDVIKKLDAKPDEVFVLVDGNHKIRSANFPQTFVIKGDGTSASIAAASVLAKVSRDEFMIELAKKFPKYGWEKNKGYLSKAHIEAIKVFGPTPYHRMSFLKNILAAEQAEQKKLFEI